MFESIISAEGLTIVQALICVGTALVLGIVASLVYMYKDCCSQNFAITLALLPPIVCMLIMMVNGNLGTGIAVVGVFSLVRFRSQPGNSKEILAIMLSMAIGLATGTGYVTFAAFGAVLVLLFFVILFSANFGKSSRQELKISIPENLDFNGLFDDIFEEFTKKNEINTVKTAQMGSVYELKYQVVLKDKNRQKEFIDAIRCRNGNLPVSCSKTPDTIQL